MKAVMISIQPKWVEKIARGEKTVEVRMTAPKFTPFKCYIYKTKKRILRSVVHKGEQDWYDVADRTRIISVPDWDGGKVIGEFVCDRVINCTIDSLECRDVQMQACLSRGELIDYFYKQDGSEDLQNKIVRGWHISDLVIYDKPKELGDFCKAGECHLDRFTVDGSKPCCICGGRLKRPFQSWGYVKDLEENDE